MNFYFFFKKKFYIFALFFFCLIGFIKYKNNFFIYDSSGIYLYESKEIIGSKKFLNRRKKIKSLYLTSNDIDKATSVRSNGPLKLHYNIDENILSVTSNFIRRNSSILVGQKWDIYIAEIENFISPKPIIKNIKKLNIIPENALINSEFRNYDPFVISFDEANNTINVLYESCYFDSKSLILKPIFKCDIQIVNFNYKSEINEKLLKSKKLFSPKYKVSFPYPVEILGKRGFLVESASEEETRLISFEGNLINAKNDLNQIVIAKDFKGYYDPALITIENDHYLLISNQEHLLVCNSKKINSKNINRRNDDEYLFNSENCKEYELGDKRFERNAGSIFKFNSKIYRFTMNNQKTYGESVDLVEIQEINPKNLTQKVIKKNFLKNEFKKLGYDFSKYHHISLIGDINKDTTYILFDAAVPFYSHSHGKKRILFE